MKRPILLIIFIILTIIPVLFAAGEEYEDIYPFCRVNTGSDVCLWGFTNDAGQVKIKPRYLGASPMVNGRHIVIKNHSRDFKTLSLAWIKAGKEETFNTGMWTAPVRKKAGVYTSYQPGMTLTVLAPSGLNLRSGPGSGYKILTNIPFLKRVALLEMPSLSNAYRSEGINGYFVKVQTVSTKDFESEQTGYLFDGFLSSIPPVARIGDGESMFPYNLADTALLNEKAAYYEIAVSTNIYPGKAAEMLAFPHWGVFKHSEWYEGGAMNYFVFYGFRPSEIFLLLRASGQIKTSLPYDQIKWPYAWPANDGDSRHELDILSDGSVLYTVGIAD